MACQDNGPLVLSQQRYRQGLHPLQELSVVLNALLPTPEVDELAAVIVQRFAAGVRPIMMDQAHNLGHRLLVLSFFHQEPTLQAIEEEENVAQLARCRGLVLDRKSTRLNSSHANISYAV